MAHELEEAADPANDDVTGDRRAARIERLVAEVFDRRERGELVAESELIAAHPDLMPELAQRLHGLRLVQRAFALARRAGPIDEPLPSAEDEQAESAAAAEESPRAAEAEDPLPRITGYELSERFRSGGQAVVFRGRRTATGEEVAVKVLPGGPFVTSNNRARFEREADILAALDHANVVGILDRGRTPDGSFFLVMPFVTGVALDTFATACRTSGGEGFGRRVLEVMEKVARAAHAAHDAGVVHRDLKPSNILVDGRDEPHLLDFGLARLQTAVPADPNAPLAADWRRHTVTVSGQVVGSLPWSSPEQAAGHAAKVGPRSDVYALGVCLYECLTGRLPLPLQGTIKEALDHICSTPPIPLGRAKERLAGVDPEGVEAVVMRALAKSPEQRQATAAALADEIRALLEGRAVAPAPAPPPPAPEPVPLSYHPGRVRVPWGLVAVLVVAGALAVPLWYFWPQLRPAGRGVVVYRQPTTTSSVGMRLVQLQAGTFRMGSATSLAPATDAEELPHTVRLSGRAWISEREVTLGDYANVMGRLPPTFPKNAPYDPQLPVTSVTWYEAMRFSEKLSEKEGKRYRLPTEAEWEYACRAGASGAWAGDGSPDTMAWHGGNSGGVIQRADTTAWNHWGIRGMHGNAAEWCLDDYVGSYPTTTSSDPLYVGNPAERVVRGGSFLTPAGQTRSAARGKLDPNARRSDVGFRVVLDQGSGMGGATSRPSAAQP